MGWQEPKLPTWKRHPAGMDSPGMETNKAMTSVTPDTGATTRLEQKPDLGGFLFRYRGWVFFPLAVLILVVGKPTLPSYLAGLLVALAGEALRIWGVGYAGLTTRGSQVIAPELVTDGPFAYVRNPLYLGNIITALGVCVMALGAFALAWRLGVPVLVALFYLGVYRTIISHEERFLQTTFGEPYRLYLDTVPRLIPRLTPARQGRGTFKWPAISQGEVQSLVMLALMCLILALKMLYLP